MLPFLSKIPTVVRNIALAIFSVSAVVLLTHILWPKQVIVLQPQPYEVRYEIPVEKLIYRDVVKYINVEDVAAVQAVLAENERLKNQVSQLSVSLAVAQTHGGGVVTLTPMDATIPVPPLSLHFEDWRLAFTSNGRTVEYALSQKFVIVNTLGKNAQNVPTTTTNLFEIGATGERMPIKTVETTTIATQTKTGTHWYAKPTIQAGISLVPVRDTTNRFGVGFEKSAAIALPWLKHGEGSVENTRYAVLVPTITFGDSGTTVGLQPISVNLGTFHQLFLTDIWLAPHIGFDPKTMAKKFSFTLLATF